MLYNIAIIVVLLLVALKIIMYMILPDDIRDIGNDTLICPYNHEPCIKGEYYEVYDGCDDCINTTLDCTHGPCDKCNLEDTYPGLCKWMKK